MPRLKASASPPSRTEAETGRRVAVIFGNRRNGADEAGYEAAAAAMAEAARQPGYLGIDSVRDATGQGITVSYWTDDATARAWRDDHAGHGAIGDRGRALWSDEYRTVVATVIRDYAWSR